MPTNVPIYANPNVVQQQGVIQKPEEERKFLYDKQGYINNVNPETNKPYTPIPQRETAHADNNTGIFYADLLTEKPQAKPELDERNQKRLKNRAMFDAFGKLLMNVGDSATLGAGGSPVLRDKPQTDKWVDEYYKNIAEHKKNLQEWEYRDYLRRLQTARTAADQKNIDTNFNRGVDNDYNQTQRWDEGQRSQIERDRLAGEQAANAARLQKGNQDINRGQLDVSRGHLDLARKRLEKEIGSPVVEYESESGQTIRVPADEATKTNYYNQAISNKSFTQARPDLFVPYVIGKDRFGDPVIEHKMNPNIKPDVVVSGYLQHISSGYFNEIKGMNSATPTPDANLGGVPSYQTDTNTQPQQQSKPNNDPLGLF